MSVHRLEGLAGLDEHCWLACRRFIAANDHIDIERVELDAAANAAGLCGLSARRLSRPSFATPALVAGKLEVTRVPGFYRYMLAISNAPR
jgi:hypothetical protein